jgi:hypothetical protein
VTGKLLTLDETLKPTLPAFLALLEVPVEDADHTDGLPQGVVEHGRVFQGNGVTQDLVG